MCTVSMIADDWRHHRLPTHPWVFPSVTPGNPPSILPGPTKEEFEALRKELEELKKKLLDGKAQDEAEGNPDCEMEEKIELLRQLGELMGVDFDEVFKPRDDS